MPNKMTNGLEMGDAYDKKIEPIEAQSGDKSRLRILAVMLTGHAEPLPRAEEFSLTLRHSEKHWQDLKMFLLPPGALPPYKSYIRYIACQAVKVTMTRELSQTGRRA